MISLRCVIGKKNGVEMADTETSKTKGTDIKSDDGVSTPDGAIDNTKVGGSSGNNSDGSISLDGTNSVNNFASSVKEPEIDKNHLDKELKERLRKQDEEIKLLKNIVEKNELDKFIIDVKGSMVPEDADKFCKMVDGMDLERVKFMYEKTSDLFKPAKTSMTANNTFSYNATTEKSEQLSEEELKKLHKQIYG